MFCTKILQNIHFSHRAFLSLHDCINVCGCSLWDKPPLHAYRITSSSSSVCVQSPVPSWCEICLHLLTGSMLIWALFVLLKSALNQSMRYLERTASDLPVCQWSQLNLKSSVRFQTNPLRCFTFFALQNKVLAVIEAIEAAQYVISHNATHLINWVKSYFFCWF